MIDERMEEQAALYVLGALSPAEEREFLTLLAANPELQAHVKRLNPAALAVGGSAPQVLPPPQLRAKILAQVAPKQKVLSLPEKKSWLPAWFPWSLAGGFAVVAALLLVQGNRLQEQMDHEGRRLQDLADLAAALQSSTNSLQQSLLALQETNRLTNVRIAMLNSMLAENPKAVAVSLWDSSKQEGVFIVQNLQPLPENRDYQLWVLENGTTPVDAGVFHVDDHGSGRIDFKAHAPVKVAGKFAVTEEVHGGAASPTLKNMVLMGG